MPPTLRYARPGLSHKFHVFNNGGRSLCYNYHFDGGDILLHGSGPAIETCKKCWDAATAIFRREQPAK